MMKACNTFLFTTDHGNAVFDSESLDIYNVEKANEEAVNKYIKGESLTENEVRSLFPLSQVDQNSMIANRTDYSFDPELVQKLTIYTTRSCNLACSYCYDRQNRIDYPCNDSIDRGLDPSKILDVVDQFLKNNVIFSIFEFIGGEPLLEFHSILSIIEQIKVLYHEKKITSNPQFGIITNGTLITEEMLSLFEKEKITITISIDIIESLHNASRVFKNGSGSFSKTIKALDLLKKVNIPISLQATITPLTFNYFQDIYEISMELMKYNIDSLIVTFGCFSENSPLSWNAFGISRLEDIIKKSIKKYLYMFEKKEIHKVSDILGIYDYITRFITKIKNNGQRCNAGLSQLSLSSDGKIYPCNLLIGGGMDYSMGDFSASNYTEIEQRLNSFISTINKDDHVECSACFARNLCTSCVGMSFKVFGAIGRNVPVLCLAVKTIVSELIKYISLQYATKESQKRFVEVVNYYITFKKQAKSVKQIT